MTVAIIFLLGTYPLFAMQYLLVAKTAFSFFPLISLNPLFCSPKSYLIYSTFSPCSHSVCCFIFSILPFHSLFTFPSRLFHREEEAIKLDGLSVSEMKQLRDQAEKFAFQAEVNRMMKLIINSLYRNKEVCLVCVWQYGCDQSFLTKHQQNVT